MHQSGSCNSGEVQHTSGLEGQIESEPVFEQENTSEVTDRYLVNEGVPDPFLVDDPYETMSEASDEDAKRLSSEDDVPAAEEIALAQSAILSTRPLSSSKPSEHSEHPSNHGHSQSEEDSSSEEDDSPLDLYLANLITPTMFHPLPNTDPLSTLLNKYVPSDRRPYRDMSGDNPQRNDFHTLVMTNNWRAVAKSVRDRIIATDPSEVSMILNLWYIRLASLARMRLFSQTIAECSNLFTALQSATFSPSSSSTHLPGTRPLPLATGAFPSNVHVEEQSQQLYEYIRERFLPFELLVLKARTKYWSGDHMGYLDELSALLGWCKSMSRKACVGNTKNSRGSKAGKPRSKTKRDEQAVIMWKERGARIVLIMASQLIEMKDYTAAIRLLSSLASSNNVIPHLHGAILRTHLQSGVLPLAEEHLRTILSADSTIAPSELKLTCETLVKSAEGKWDEVETLLKDHIDKEKLKGNADVDKTYYVAVNNLSVALLSQGKLNEAIQVLEEALHQSPSTILTAEPFLFNLSTLYELRSNTAADKKRDLLIEVGKWAGDGVRTSCLKMPIS